MEFSVDEHEVLTNIWGSEVPQNPEMLDDEQVIVMLIQVARGVGASIQDGDAESLTILEPIEQKPETVPKSGL